MLSGVQQAHITIISDHNNIHLRIFEQRVCYSECVVYPAIDPSKVTNNNNSLVFLLLSYMECFLQISAVLIMGQIQDIHTLGSVCVKDVLLSRIQIPNNGVRQKVGTSLSQSIR